MSNIGWITSWHSVLQAPPVLGDSPAINGLEDFKITELSENTGTIENKNWIGHISKVDDEWQFNNCFVNKHTIAQVSVI